MMESHGTRHLGAARVVKPCTPARHRIPSMEASWRRTPAVSARREAGQLGGQRLAATKKIPVAQLFFFLFRLPACSRPRSREANRTSGECSASWLDRLARQTASLAPLVDGFLGPAPSRPGPVAVMLRLQQPGRDKTDGRVPVVFRLPGSADGIDRLCPSITSTGFGPCCSCQCRSELTQGRVSVSRLRGPAAVRKKRGMRRPKKKSELPLASHFLAPSVCETERVQGVPGGQLHSEFVSEARQRG